MASARFLPLGFDRSAMAASMREKGIDAVLLSSPENVFYTTGYPPLPYAGNPILYALRNQLPAYSFIEHDGRVTLFAWIGAVLGEVEFGADHLEMFADRRGAHEVLKNFLAAKKLEGKIVGIESSCPYTVAMIFDQDIGPMGLTVVDAVMDALRAVKSAEEVEAVRKSTAIAEATVNELMDVIRPGISRPWLIREIKARLIKNGADGASHVTVSFGGSNPEVEIDERLDENRLVVLDIGASRGGYVSDIRRHAYTGEVPGGLQALYSRMCGLVDEVSRGLIPGKTGKDIYDLSVKLYEENGFIPLIVNAGHTMGINTEEIWLSREADLTLKAGMIVNLELYTQYEETHETIGDEETYLITEKGPVQLTELPRVIRKV
jgi:Xaa-Pro dipeptidase